MPKARPLPASVFSVGKKKTKSGKQEYAFTVPCIKCGAIRTVMRRQHAISMSLKPCKACSNKNNNPIGLVGSIRASFFRKFETGAFQRNKVWNVTIEFCNEVLEKQNHLCALSGLPISAKGAFDQITASLDRIDNAKGYEIGNVQWVHKEINMMRGPLPIDRFVQLCQSVAEKSEVVN
jgi:hypothetical protein